MIVVDNNLIVAFAIRTAETETADKVQKKDREWIAPPLWESEFRNAMLGLIRAGKISHQTALNAAALAHNNVDTFAVSTGAVLRIAERHGLTAYDAEYAALAEWLEIPCLSFDTDLLKTGLAVHPKDF
jgi:predicted nucleic acid-binding protein